MSETLLFWNPGPHLRLAPAEVAREIVWGEEVEGTWTWQHIKVDCRELQEGDRQRLIDTIEAAGCQAYDPARK
jgi:hypothetical protein